MAWPSSVPDSSAPLQGVFYGFGCLGFRGRLAPRSTGEGTELRILYNLILRDDCWGNGGTCRGGGRRYVQRRIFLFQEKYVRHLLEKDEAYRSYSAFQQQMRRTD